jgi:pimeloyl-ACP methyl ester carboxylesterase
LGQINVVAGGWLMLCELPDATVHYEEFGEGRPIVMLHGSPLDQTAMVCEVEPRFAKRPGWRRTDLAQSRKADREN